METNQLDGDVLVSDDVAIIEFGNLWERGDELSSVIMRLPSVLVLKSGQAARRKSLLDRWSCLESPGLDGSFPDGAIDGIKKWNHDAEVLISYIVRIGMNPLGKAYPSPTIGFSNLPQVINSIDEAKFVDEDWCWPWVYQSLSIVERPKKWSKENVVKAGVVAGLGMIALVAYLDEG